MRFFLISFVVLFFLFSLAVAEEPQKTNSGQSLMNRIAVATELATNRAENALNKYSLRGYPIIVEFTAKDGRVVAKVKNFYGYNRGSLKVAVGTVMFPKGVYSKFTRIYTR